MKQIIFQIDETTEPVDIIELRTGLEDLGIELPLRCLIRIRDLGVLVHKYAGLVMVTGGEGDPRTDVFTFNGGNRTICGVPLDVIR